MVQELRCTVGHECQVFQKVLLKVIFRDILLKKINREQMVLGSQALTDKKLVRNETIDEKMQINKIVHFIQTCPFFVQNKARLTPRS